MARIGGDEFLVSGIAADGRGEAESLADRVRRSVAECAARFGGLVIPLTCSIGIALARPGEADAETLIHNADSALYRAKQEGRNQVSWYDPVASVHLLHG